ncbi:hypothetical protein AVEN_119040-1 [Araneus ventricosus]|uniref:Gustatory receptor n=1 Tax=Araneus ventricosus TaxID=182803 RepID=A0A4Y2FEN9_ARAVE|nr:hypothetical protein AVEN_119040-1 [Araneus ventricosus]
MNTGSGSMRMGRKRFESFLEQVYSPLLILFHAVGMDTLPCPKFFRKQKLCKFLWNSPRYIFNFALLFVLVAQVALVLLLPLKKRELASLFVIILQISAHIFMLRFNECIRGLLKKMSKILKMLNCHNRRKVFENPIYAYCLYSTVSSIGFITVYLISNMRIQIHGYIRHTTDISEEYKEFCIFLLEIRNVLTVSLLLGLSVSSSGYYGFICYHIYLLLSEFSSKSINLIVISDYETILKIYLDISQVIVSVDDFLSYPTFINVLADMGGLFWACYVIIFDSKDDYLFYLYFVAAAFTYALWLLMVMLPAASANKAIEVARNFVLSLPGWFPHHQKVLKKYIKMEIKHNNLSLTLWKIYKIDNSLLISSIGTLVSYGIIVGTLGTVQSSSSAPVNETAIG